MSAESEEQRQNRGQRAVNRYDSVLSKFEYLFVIVAGILLFVMILSVSYSVIGRRFFGLPGAWAVELSEYIMLYITFLAAPWVLKLSGHVRVDVFISLLRPRIQNILNVLTTILAAVAFLVLFRYSLEVAIESYQRGVVLRRIIQVPEYLLLFVIPLGSLFLFLRLICQLLQRFVGGEDDGDQPRTQAPEI